MSEILTVPPITKIGRLPSDLDRKMIDVAKRLARSLTAAELSELRTQRLPRVCDYSRFITLIRDQDGAGGCGGMATLAVADILKERERPYTPDLSHRFASYVYNQSSLHHQDPRITHRGLNQATSLIQYGCCAETTWPTNFDPPANVFPDNQQPPDACFAEAKLYRIASWSDHIAFTDAEQLKLLVVRHGPLIAFSDSHVFAILGYNDDLGAFTLLNSWGDRWGDNGMVKVPYDKISNPFGEDHTFDVKRVAYLVNLPTPSTAHPFTGQIRVRHEHGRRYLTIRVGAEGWPAMTIWDRPNQVAMQDNSLNLAFNFPLPAYARSVWPPSDKRWWYVEVTDSSQGPPSEVAAMVEDVVLVQRIRTAQNRWIPILHRPSARDFAVRHGGTIRIYIPMRKRYSLYLGSSISSVAAGSPVDLHGNLFTQIALSSTRSVTVPLRDQSVSVYRTNDDSIEGTIREERIGTVQTDESGKFTLGVSPTETAEYQGIATRPDNSVLAVSNSVRVEVA